MVVYSTQTVNHIGPESWNLLLNDHKYQPLLSLRKLRLIKIKGNAREMYQVKLSMQII